MEKMFGNMLHQTLKQDLVRFSSAAYKNIYGFFLVSHIQKVLCCKLCRQEDIST